MDFLRFLTKDRFDIADVFFGSLVIAAYKADGVGVAALVFIFAVFVSALMHVATRRAE